MWYQRDYYSIDNAIVTYAWKPHDDHSDDQNGKQRVALLLSHVACFKETKNGTCDFENKGWTKIYGVCVLQEGGQPAEIVHGSQSSPHDKQDLLWKEEIAGTNSMRMMYCAKDKRVTTHHASPTDYTFALAWYRYHELRIVSERILYGFPAPVRDANHGNGYLRPKSIVLLRTS